MKKVEALAEAIRKADVVHVNMWVMSCVIHSRSIRNGNGDDFAVTFVDEVETAEPFTNDELANATVDGNKIIVDQDGNKVVIELFNRVPALIEL